MAENKLARLERVNLREQWPDEAVDFTPWLADEENLALLGETLCIELELEAQEKSVGPFRADILCKDTVSGAWVLIENQLEKTDHNHLGQLLTYASGLEAVVIIWIAERFTDEHRSTFDWLNRITDESFHFFGLEVEVLRIGNSLCAPNFKIVSKPNDWSRSVVQAARGQISDMGAMQLDYWREFLQVLNGIGGTVSGNRKPQPQGWMEFPVGRSGFQLHAVMRPTKQHIRAELYISKGKAFFHLLQKQKQDIEREFGTDVSLRWEELPSRSASKVIIDLADVDPGDREDWHRQHHWLATKLNDMHRVFSPRVQNLNADDWDELSV